MSDKVAALTRARPASSTGSLLGLSVVGVHPLVGRRSLARVLRCPPLVVGVQPSHSRIKSIIRRLFPGDGAAVAPVEEGGTIDSRGVAVTPRVRPVNGRLFVGLLL